VPRRLTGPEAFLGGYRLGEICDATEGLELLKAWLDWMEEQGATPSTIDKMIEVGSGIINKAMLSVCGSTRPPPVTHDRCVGADHSQQTIGRRSPRGYGSILSRPYGVPVQRSVLGVLVAGEAATVDELALEGR
jgi:hypothetical protein